MVITFNELRRIKDKLPSGSSQRIAEEVGVSVDEVRNYFGGRHFDGAGAPGLHGELRRRLIGGAAVFQFQFHHCAQSPRLLLKMRTVPPTLA